MKERAEEIVAQLQAVTDDVTATFGGLSSEQLNWRPADGGWSIAQCLDHLIVMNRMYVPTLRALRKPVSATFWEQFSPFSGFFGRALIKAVHPDNQRRTKTGKKAVPAAGPVEPGIVQRFAEHQADLIERLRALPQSVHPKETILTSPLSSLVTYSLDDALTVLVLHEQRHVQQAKRVLAASAEVSPNTPEGAVS